MPLSTSVGGAGFPRGIRWSSSSFHSASQRERRSTAASASRRRLTLSWATTLDGLDLNLLLANEILRSFGSSKVSCGIAESRLLSRNNVQSSLRLAISGGRWSIWFLHKSRDFSLKRFSIPFGRALSKLPLRSKNLR